MTDLEFHTDDLIYSLAASPDFAQDGICLAARSSGLVISEDGGQSWKDAFASLNLTETLTTTAVCVSPDFPIQKHIFAGFPGGILLSLDGGKSWQTARAPTPPPVITVLETSPNYARDRCVFAGTMEDGMLLSVDGGASWHPWNFGLLDARVMALAISPGFARDGTLFTATETGIFRSSNNGRSWSETNFPPELAPVLCLALSPNFSQDSTLFAGTESNGLLKSIDEGNTWQRLGEEAIIGVVNAILISPEYPNRKELLLLGEDKLLVSCDDGETWSERPVITHLETALTCVIAPEGFRQGAKLLVGSQDGGVIIV
jgi:photosystem II stability/assembly factor-like uncharacterized protein